jgi:hypothetical protein
VNWKETNNVYYIIFRFYVALEILWHCDTSRKVPASIPGGVTWNFFPWHPTIPCARGRLSLLNMSARILLRVKTAGA